MISYIGGKSKIGSWIKSYIPKDINVYVEPFGGMYWTFFNMDIESYTNLKKVVYNDSNPLNVNVFNCIKDYDTFYNTIKNYESQKLDLFYLFQKELFIDDLNLDLSESNYDIASKYIYLLTQVWSGTNVEKGKFIDLKGKYKSKFDTFKDKLKNPKWQNYFNKITTVENLDFEEVIKKYDSQDTYFYCDPPYYNLGEKYYVNHDFNISTHERLSKVLKSLDGRFSLSYYDFDLLHEWFPKSNYRWESKQFSKAASAKSGKEQKKGTELLIMNYF